MFALAVTTVVAALVLSVRLRVDTVTRLATSADWLQSFNQGALPPDLLLMLNGMKRSAMAEAWSMGFLSAFGAFGGLWTALLFRQVSAALWLTLLMPLGLALMAGLTGLFSDELVMPGLWVVMGAYGICGFVGAKRLFLRAQDTSWTGGVVTLFRQRAKVAEIDGEAGGFGPVRALLTKELQFQQMNLLLALGLLAAHAGVILFRLGGRDYLDTHRSLGMMLESFPLVWLVLPLVVGSVAVAEERKLGTITEQLCLPVSRRLQYGLKLAFTLLLGTTLGGLVPLAVEAVGGVLGLNEGHPSVYFMEQILSVGLMACLGSAVIALVSFYASSLSFNTLQAIGVSMAACIGLAGLGSMTVNPLDVAGVPLWGTALVVMLGSPLLLGAVLALGYSNYRQLQLRAPMWRRNLAAMGLVLAGTVIIAISLFHRFWEMWLPREPLRNPYTASVFTGVSPVGRVAVREQVAEIEGSWFVAGVVLPDGRLWLQFRIPPEGTQEFLVEPWRTENQAGPWKGEYVPGENWGSVAVSEHGSYGVKRDGSLWLLAGPVNPGLTPEIELRPFAEGSWISITAGAAHFTGLRADGTIWEWGRLVRLEDGRPARVEAERPLQVGAETDWVAVSDRDETSVGMRRDGSFWRWGKVVDRDELGKVTSHLANSPERWLTWKENKARSLSVRGAGIAAVAEDGTMWVGGAFGERLISISEMASARTNLVPFAQDSRWQQVHWGAVGGLRALDEAGTIVEWNPWGVLGPDQSRVQPTVPSRYSNWLAVGPVGTRFLALGADGVLCEWTDSEEPWAMPYSRVTPGGTFGGVSAQGAKDHQPRTLIQSVK